MQGLRVIMRHCARGAYGLHSQVGLLPSERTSELLGLGLLGSGLLVAPQLEHAAAQLLVACERSQATVLPEQGIEERWLVRLVEAGVAEPSLDKPHQLLFLVVSYGTRK
jgi:hypothetical protein